MLHKSGGKWVGKKKKTWSIENKSTENLQVNPGDCSGDHCVWQQVVLCFVCNLLCWNNYTIMLSSVSTSPRAWPWSIKTIQSSTPSQIITWQNNRSMKPFIWNGFQSAVHSCIFFFLVNIKGQRARCSMWWLLPCVDSNDDKRSFHPARTHWKVCHYRSDSDTTTLTADSFGEVIWDTWLFFPLHAQI